MAAARRRGANKRGGAPSVSVRAAATWRFAVNMEGCLVVNATKTKVPPQHTAVFAVAHHTTPPPNSSIRPLAPFNRESMWESQAGRRNAHHITMLGK